MGYSPACCSGCKENAMGKKCSGKLSSDWKAFEANIKSAATKDSSKKAKGKKGK